MGGTSVACLGSWCPAIWRGLKEEGGVMVKRAVRHINREKFRLYKTLGVIWVNKWLIFTCK